MLIGIDDSHGIIYEGGSDYGGRLLWPSPLITPLTFYRQGDAKPEASTTASGWDVTYYFREDYFDPVSRIRRGRIYKRGDVQPRSWHVMPHPAAMTYSSDREIDGTEKKSLLTYQSCAISRELNLPDINSVTLILGVGEVSSQWSIIDIECIASNEELVTIKAKQSFGILPKINWSKIPISFREKVRETLETLLNDVHRAGPESVIDRCRDAASALLRAHLGKEHAKKDLGKLIAALSQVKPESKKRIVISASEIIRIFHPRAKPSEQESRAVRPVREQDAELAVQCIGTILCELGWADWHG